MMVQQNPQTRLLVNLLKANKEYTSSLATHLLASHTALSGLQAYASASNPSTTHAILGVADALKAADDALARYSNEVDSWKERLKELKDAEEELSNILRDREILVTRLIKASSRKPTRDSVIHPPSPTASQVSLGSSSKATQQERLNSAQAELQACEAQISNKQRELEQLRSLAIRDGLQARCAALVQLGSAFNESGSLGIRALQDGYTEAALNAFPHDRTAPDESYRNVPRPSSPGAASDASLAPSQSASQSGGNEPMRGASTLPPPPSAVAYRMDNVAEEGESSGSEIGDLQVVENHPRGAGSSRIKQSTKPLTWKRSTSQPTSPFPPPHNHAPTDPLPTHMRFGNLPHRDHSSDVGIASSDPFALPRRNVRRRDSSSTASLRDATASDGGRKRRGFFSAVASLFKSKKDGGRGDPADKKSTDPSTWSTRTDKNVADMRTNGVVGPRALDDSSDEGHQNLLMVSNRPPERQLTVSMNTSPSKGGGGKANGDLSVFLTDPTNSKGLTRSNSATTVPSRLKSKRKRASSVFSAGVSGDGGSSAPISSSKINKHSASSPTPQSAAPSKERPTSLPANATAAKTIVIGISPSSGAAIAAETPSRNTSIKAPSRAAAPTKALHLTPPTEVSTTWLNNTPLKQHASHHNTPSRHTRTASAETAISATKPVNLMSLVDNVVNERARDVTIGHLHRVSMPRMILPSEYMRGGDVPSLQVNSPTPRPGSPNARESHHAPAHHTNINGDKSHEPPKRSLTQSSRNGSSLEVKHEPLPRSASPLRSAMRHRSPSPTRLPSVSIPPPPSAPLPVFASFPTQTVTPVPIRPRSWARDSEDGASAYETALSENESNGDIPTPTLNKENPLAVALTSLEARAAAGTNGLTAGHPTNSPPSTEVSTIDGVVRRKSVRLDVPITPKGGHHLYHPDHSTLPDTNRALPKLPSAVSPRPHHTPKKQREGTLPTNTSSGSSRGWHSRIGDDGLIADAWADSSGEDENYSKARGLLDNARKRETAAKAEVARLLGDPSKQATR